MKKTVFLSLSALVVVLVLSAAVNSGVIGAVSGVDHPVSPALAIIARNTPMAKCGVTGNEILFSPEDFERALDVSRLSSITVTEIPSITDGELLIGSVVVQKGQVISRENLCLLSYAPRGENGLTSEFCFTAGDGGYSMTCSLHMLESINYSPTTSGGAVTVSTYRDIAAYGKLHGYDPDGDRLYYQIVSYPRHGIVLLYDDDGRYVYMPNSDFVGTDSLDYVVYDQYGNYSAAATVKLSVSRSTAADAYADLMWNAAHSAALTLTQRGIMSGRQVGDRAYFDPEGTVSREEFIVMAMHAAGVVSLPAVADTGFFDDVDISPEAKSYVAAAARAGYISPVVDGGNRYFLPDEPVTVSDASGICAAILGLEADGSVAAAWGTDSVSVAALVSEGIVDAAALGSGKDALTRGSAAIILETLIS